MTRATSRETIISGSLLLGAGAIATGLSYLASSGSVFLICTGAIAVGLLRIGAGLASRYQEASQVDARQIPGDAFERYISPAAVAARKRRRVRLSALALAVIVPLVLLNAWFDSLDTLCLVGRTAPTLGERKSAMARAASRLRGMSFLPSAGAVLTCREVDYEMTLIDRGECPGNPIDGMSCRCGKDQLPIEPHCQVDAMFCLRRPFDAADQGTLDVECRPSPSR